MIGIPVICVAWVLILGCWLFFGVSRKGAGVRAVHSDPDLARATGINPGASTISRSRWGQLSPESAESHRGSGARAQIGRAHV